MTATAPSASVPGAAQTARRGVLALSLLAGAAISVQVYVNGRLGEVLGSPLHAATISNGTALTVVLVLALLTAALPRGRRTLVRARAAGSVVRPWWFLGGMLGSGALVANIFAEPFVGVALLTVAGVLGRLSGGLAADRLSLGPAGRRPVTVRRVAAMVLALVAVGVGTLGYSGPLHLGALAMVMVGGVAAAVQQAGNGQLARVTGEPLAMATLNFAVGFLAVTAVAGLVALPMQPSTWPDAPGWAWTGGVLAAGVATCSALAVRRLSVLQHSLGLIAGQAVAAVALDAAVPRPEHTLTVTTLVGVVLACLAVAVAADPRPRRRACETARSDVSPSGRKEVEAGQARAARATTSRTRVAPDEDEGVER